MSKPGKEILTDGAGAPDRTPSDIERLWVWAAGQGAEIWQYAPPWLKAAGGAAVRAFTVLVTVCGYALRVVVAAFGGLTLWMGIIPWLAPERFVNTGYLGVYRAVGVGFGFLGLSLFCSVWGRDLPFQPARRFIEDVGAAAVQRLVWVAVIAACLILICAAAMLFLDGDAVRSLSFNQSPAEFAAACVMIAAALAGIDWVSRESRK